MIRAYVGRKNRVQKKNIAKTKPKKDQYKARIKNKSNFYFTHDCVVASAKKH